MVVVGIIMLLATIGIPPLMRSRMASREAFATTSLRNLCNACYMYVNQYDDYPAELAVLGQGELPILNSSVVNATNADTAVKGFYFQYSIDDATGTFEIIAEPKGAVVSNRHFRVTERGLIQVAPLGSTDWKKL